MSRDSGAGSLLAVSRLSLEMGRAPVLRDISLAVNRGEIVGLVGESGSGKTTLLRAVTGLPDPAAHVAGGSVLFCGADLLQASPEALRRIRGAQIAAISQNPAASLCPMRTVGRQFLEAARSHLTIGKQAVYDRAAALLESLHLPDARGVLESYPFQLSGGMSQRVGIALAMLLEPALLLADEPTSALDVTVQAQVVGQLLELRERYGTGILIVSHNMGVVARMADRIGVMYAGRVVEHGPGRRVLRDPLHPYTKALLDCVPRPDARLPAPIPGDSSVGVGAGCAFAPRCARRQGDCTAGEVPRAAAAGGHWALCRHPLGEAGL